MHRLLWATANGKTTKTCPKSTLTHSGYTFVSYLHTAHIHPLLTASNPPYPIWVTGFIACTECIHLHSGKSSTSILPFDWFINNIQTVYQKQHNRQQIIVLIPLRHITLLSLLKLSCPQKSKSSLQMTTDPAIPLSTCHTVGLWVKSCPTVHGSQQEQAKGEQGCFLGLDILLLWVGWVDEEEAGVRGGDYSPHHTEHSLLDLIFKSQLQIDIE